jgi:HEPN domain-containing protein
MQHDEAVSLVTREWLVKAQHDLVAGERAAEDPPIADVACFHAQQAAEKALKGYLAWCDIPLQRTHDLARLLTQARDVDEAFGSLESAADLLSPYATDPRYPGQENEPEAEDAIEALAEARRVLEFVLVRLPSDIHP